MIVEVSRTFKRIVKFRYEKDRLYVVANYFVSRKKIKSLIEENIDWIRKQKEEAGVCIDCTRTAETELMKEDDWSADTVYGDIFTGRKTLILGDVVTVAPYSGSKTKIEGDVLYINDKSYESKDLRLKSVSSYIKKIASIYVAAEISKFGTENSLCPSKIEFKSLSSGWAKCSSAAEKILCLDYRVSQLPCELREYVIAHAFAHFYSSSHDEEFYRMMKRFVPSFASFDNELSKYRFLKEI